MYQISTSDKHINQRHPI